MTGDVNDVMPGSDGLGFLLILNKSSELRFELRRSELIFRTWARSVQLFAAGCARAFVGSDETVSIVKIVCLSLSSSQIPKSQEGNKSFVPELRESSVFRVFLIPMRINILWTLWMFYTSIYLYICIMSMLHTWKLWKKFWPLTSLKNLLHTCHIYMSLNCIEIKTKIWIMI